MTCSSFSFRCHFCLSLPYFCLLGVLCVFSTVYADTRYPNLAEGTESHEVLKLWGAPKEKIEKETKREEIWLYDAARVSLRNGKVVTWAEVVNGKEVSASDVLAAREGAEGRLPADLEADKSRDPAGVEDILSEIMKEVPSDDSNPQAPGGLGPTSNTIRPVEPIQ